MADETEDAFIARLKGDTVGAAALTAPTAPVLSTNQFSQETTPAGPPPLANPSSLLPLSSNELSKINAPPAMESGQPEWQRRLGAEPGVKFHPEGLDTWSDIMVKARMTTEDKLRYLVGKFGKENVRLNEMEEPVVRIMNEKTGKPEDYPVDPRQWTMKSITGLAAQAPEMVGAALGVRLAGPNAGVFLRSLAASLGIAGAETFKEKQTAETPRTELEMFGTHLPEVPINLVADLTTGGLIKGGQIAGNLARKGFPEGIPNPLAGTKLFKPSNPELTSAGNQAAARIAAKSGIQPKLTVAEVTGIPAFAMGEVYAESQVAGTSIMEKQIQNREQYSKDIQAWITDPATLGTDEEVGKRGLAILKDWIQPLKDKIALLKDRLGIEGKLDEKALLDAQQKTVQQTQLDLVNKLGSGQIPLQGVDKTSMGDALATKYLDARKVFRDTERDLYEGPNGVFALPQASDPIITPRGLVSDLEKLRDELPKVTKTVMQPGKLLSPQGTPVVIPVQKEVPVETPIRPRLESLIKNLQGGQVGLRDLKEMRTDIDNAIQGFDPLTGVKEGRLKYVYKSLTKAIDDGLRQINDPELTARWRTATDYHAANVERFTGKTVTPLAHDAEQAGTIGNTAFVNKLISSPDSYAAAKAFFGANSPEMGAFLKTTRDHLMEQGLAGNTVDGSKLVTALEGLRASNPKLFKDALGGRGAELIREAEMLGGFQKKLPLDEVSKALNPAMPRRMTLLSMQVSQKKLDEAFDNGILNHFIKGEGAAAGIEPQTLARRLPGYKLSDVKAVIDRISTEDPDYANQLARKTVENLLQDAKRPGRPIDILHKLQGRPGEILSAPALQNALGTGDKLEAYKTILGPEIYSNLSDLIQVELLGEEKRRIARGVGVFSKGQGMHAVKEALEGLATPTPAAGKRGITEIGGLIKDKILAYIVTRPGLSSWLSRPEQLANMPKTLNVIFTSEPFIKALLAETGSPGAAYKAAAGLRSMTGGAGATERQESEDDFINRLKARNAQP